MVVPTIKHKEKRNVQATNSATISILDHQIEPMGKGSKVHETEREMRKKKMKQHFNTTFSTL